VLASDTHVVVGDYVGTSGVSGMFDTNGVLHIGYWTSGDHIKHTGYTYYTNTNTLTTVITTTQVDTATVKANHPQLAVSPADNSVTIAWVSENATPKILARTRSAAGTWGSVETASTDPVWTSTSFGINIDQGPSLVISSNGTKHLTYIENYDPTDYGHLHYVSNTGGGWVDLQLSMYTHAPSVAINSAGDVYLLGHGHSNNTSTPCTSMIDWCTIKRNTNGTWGAPQLFATPSTGNGSLDASASVKWSVVGYNRPDVIEFVFFEIYNGDYNKPTLYYGRR
jgi:hypothetical protein